MHVHTEASAHRGGGVRVESRRARHREANACERVGGRSGVVEREPRVEDRGNGRDHGHVVGAYARERLGRVEMVDQRDGRAGPQREAEHDVEAVDVEHRQHAEGHVVGMQSQPRMRLHLFEIREQRAVRQDCGFRSAGRSRGEQQHGRIVFVARDERRCSCGRLGLGRKHCQRRCTIAL